MRKEMLVLLLMVSFASALSVSNISVGTEKLESATLSDNISDLFGKNLAGEYNWIKVSLLLIVISLIANAMIYMIAKAFQLTYLESGFKLEMREAFFNVMIIVFFGALTIFLDTAMSAPLMCETHTNCIVDTSINYVDKLIDASKLEISKTEKDVMKATMTRSVGGTVGWSGITVGYAYDWAGINRVNTIEPSEKVGLYQQAVMNLMVIKVFLMFFAYYIGPMLIVFGIMFKCLFVTRRLGSTMIALGVAASIVLPLTIISILVANGEVKVPGAAYITNKDCPEECMKTVGGFNSTSSLDTSQILEMAKTDSSITIDQVSRLINGSTASLTISGLGPVFSCESYNIIIRNSLNATYRENAVLASRMDNENYTVTVDCPSLCRNLPYPYDMPECRDAELACRRMQIQAPKCFKGNFGFENLNYTVVYDGTPVNLSKALANSNCFRVTPLSIVAKEDPLRFCPSKCRFFYSDGSTPCPFTEYNCSEIYVSAAGVEHTNQIEAKITGIYTSIKTSLSSTTVDTNALVTESNKIAFPIYEVDNPGCLNVMKLPENMRYVPNALDCSACQDEGGNKPGAKTQEGKMLAYSIILSTFSIAITLAAAVALSMGIEGEMFIPGLNRVK